MTHDGFSRSVWISMMAHGIVAMLVFLRAIILPNEQIQIRDAIRVDVVGLPEKTQQLPEEPAPPTKPEPVKTAEAEPIKPKRTDAKPTAPTLPDPKAKRKDLSKSQKDALAKLKAMDALNKIKSEVVKEKAAKPAPTVAGNSEFKGNSLTGLEKIEYDRYFDDIKSKVLSQWNLPRWLADADYKASVTVLIDERGFVLKKVIRRSSGNEVFDAKTMEAIDASSPLPAPPQRLRGLLSTSGITFNFPE